MSKREREKRRERARQHQDEQKSVTGRRSGFGVLDLSKSKEEVEWFKPKKESYVVNFIPFLVSTDKLQKLRDPDGKLIGRKEGDEQYKLEVPIHRNIGPENKTVLCRLLAYGIECFICEQKVGLDWNKDKRTIRAHSPQWRDYYNIEILEPVGHDGKVLLWDVAYKSFESEMLDELKETEIDEDRKIYIGDSGDDACSVKFRGVEKTMVNDDGDVINFVGFKSFKFQEREKEIPDDMLELAHPLDAMLIIPPDYDYVKNLYLGTDVDPDAEAPPEEDEEKREPRRTTSPPDDEEKDDKPPKEEEGKKDLSWDNLDDMDDTEMLEFITQEGLKVRGAPRMKERELRKALKELKKEMDKKAKKDKEKEQKDEPKDGDNPCPFGHVYGKECDSHPDCDKCDDWDKCFLAKQEMEK